ncbi:hypothetical protein [Halosimplex pelagicum]|uniref:Uncharacterized protein n=1 Tax=Halosimplex pelagicum TaxID=869886 RepID=A0A7D5PEK2_9EURY|nr:hypothetical protein [Halosimplex pelagicum]QLH82160.1 hypothetical protein HZS54_11330 [Halosimplex pelagicum]
MSTNSSTQSQSDSTGSQPNIEQPTESVDEQTANSDDEGTSQDSDSVTGTEAFDITAQTQMQFGESGELEPKNDAVEVTLDEFDVDIDQREKETQIDRPEATGLMADDRPELDTRDGGEQANLFADAEEEQQTLTGESAQNQCLFDAVDEEE